MKNQKNVSSSNPRTDQPDLPKEALEHLYHEADHFFKAELASEQRGSWLLALNVALAAALISLLVVKWTNLPTSMLNIYRVLVIIVFGLVCYSCWVALLTVVPLWGRNGGEWGKTKKNWSDSLDPDRLSNPTSLAWKHYVRHRIRSEIKADRIQRAIRLSIAAIVFWTVTALALSLS